MYDDNLYIRFDWAIKHILRDKANFDILEGFISVLLGEKVKIVELLESESNQENDRDKFNRVDIKAKNSHGHIIIIEVQLTSKLDYFEKIHFGRCKVITKDQYSGCKYEHMKKVYSINLLYCDYGKGDDYIYHGHTLLKGLHTGNELLVKIREKGVIVNHLPKEVFPEYYLVCVNAYKKAPDTPLDEWLTFIKTGHIKPDTHTQGLQEVRKKLQVSSMTSQEVRVYEKYLDNIMVQNDVLDTAFEEGIALGRQDAYIQSREAGRAEAIHSVVLSMEQQGMNSEEISKFTGLSQSDFGLA